MRFKNVLSHNLYKGDLNLYQMSLIVISLEAPHPYLYFISFSHSHISYACTLTLYQLESKQLIPSHTLMHLPFSTWFNSSLAMFSSATNAFKENIEFVFGSLFKRSQGKTNTANHLENFFDIVEYVLKVGGPLLKAWFKIT